MKAHAPRRCSPRPPTRRRFPAPSDARPLSSDGAPPRPLRAPNTAGSSLSGAREPQRVRHRPSRPPSAYGSSLSTPLRASTQRGRVFGSLASKPVLARPSRASAHVSCSRFSVIGCPRSSNSSRVAAERRRSIPPHSLRRHPLGPIPLQLVGDILLRSSSRGDPRPTPLHEADPRDRPPPPTSTKRSRAPSPVAMPQGDGARTFLAATWARRLTAPKALPGRERGLVWRVRSRRTEPRAHARGLWSRA